MKLTLGKRADYSVRAVLDLARHHGDGRRTTRAIAAEMAIPVNYLPALLAELVRAGLVRSVAGRGGGYVLARAPEQVSLLEVIEVAEDEPTRECVLRGGPCRWQDACAVHEPLSEAREALRSSLAATSFADLVARDAALDVEHAATGHAHDR
ncbi:Rrf2 family transcriptional regulator [Egicoccus sp. AB-alg6-2]|uniref:RrF2 family transcriptional regulator n=1 Tax=Egicoccus sp. AB-alg6-2 TaxID=3242692 RepID=UPI00359CCDE5